MTRVAESRRRPHNVLHQSRTTPAKQVDGSAESTTSSSTDFAIARYKLRQIPPISYQERASRGINRRRWQKVEKQRSQQKIRWKRTVRGGREVNINNGDRGNVSGSRPDDYAETPPETSLHKTDGRACTVQSEHNTTTAGVLGNVGRLDIENSDAAVSRRRLFLEAESHERIKAMELYRKTRDASVFDPFLAPFIGGPNRPQLGPWVWEKSVERWRRENTLNGAIIWAPTHESFL
ncbi:hypothetical protein B0H66DRAFT_286894 [Apodospora peruviana]|uniref:Uncharacterized protein n=1 Tax=Apodospora peruviana TaxID=516989 RepID=A0AAE0I0X3_9PEZI|nr:hypothetical protein B0H66DRAFT_286894 [Apodospora peruviana]